MSATARRALMVTIVLATIAHGQGEAREVPLRMSFPWMEPATLDEDLALEHLSPVDYMRYIRMKNDFDYATFIFDQGGTVAKAASGEPVAIITLTYDVLSGKMFREWAEKNDKQMELLPLLWPEDIRKYQQFQLQQTETVTMVVDEQGQPLKARIYLYQTLADGSRVPLGEDPVMSDSDWQDALLELPEPLRAEIEQSLSDWYDRQDRQDEAAVKSGWEVRSGCYIHPMPYIADETEGQRWLSETLVNAADIGQTAAFETLGRAIGTTSGKILSASGSAALSLILGAKTVGNPPDFGMALVGANGETARVEVGEPVVPVFSTFPGDCPYSSINTFFEIQRKSGWFSWERVERVDVLTRSEAEKISMRGSFLFIPRYPVVLTEPGRYRICWGRDMMPTDRAEKVIEVVPPLGKGGIRSPLYDSDLFSQTVFVADISGSMDEHVGNQTKLEAVREAVGQVLSLLADENAAESEPVHSAALVTFAGSGHVVCELTPDLASVQDGAKTLRTGSGGTNLGAGLTEGIRVLASSESQTDVEAIVVLSDGMSNAGLSPEGIMADPVPTAQNLGFTIYTVGFGNSGAGGSHSGLDVELLTKIAQNTGGQYHFADDAHKLRDIYLRIRARSFGNMIAEKQGEVRQGEEIIAALATVSERISALESTVSYPGSLLKLRLTDPSGSSLTGQDSAVTVTELQGLTRVLVRDPAPGVWSIGVQGVDVPGETEPFRLMVSSRAEPSEIAPQQHRHLSAGLLTAASGGLLLLTAAFAWLWAPKESPQDTARLL